VTFNSILKRPSLIAREIVASRRRIERAARPFRQVAGSGGT
jgi:hypothetical protein